MSRIIAYALKKVSEIGSTQSETSSTKCTNRRCGANDGVDINQKGQVYCIVCGVPLKK